MNVDNLLRMNPGDFTLGIIKPKVSPEIAEAVFRELVDAKLDHYIVKPRRLTELQVRALYYEHLGKRFYPRNAEYMMSGRSILVLITGRDAQVVFRAFIIPKIRDRWAIKSPKPDQKHLTIVHGSDSPVAALREVALLWPFDEVMHD